MDTHLSLETAPAFGLTCRWTRLALAPSAQVKYYSDRSISLFIGPLERSSTDAVPSTITMSMKPHCHDADDMNVRRILRPRWASVSLAFVGSVMSCSDDVRLEGLPTQRQEEPVVNILADDQVLAGVPTNVYSIGRQDGAESEVLHRVRSVAFDGQNNLYILDGQHRVLVFDTAGVYVRQVGREGDGPGELRFPRHVAVTPSGHIVVDDARHRSWIVFDVSGQYVRAIPWRLFRVGTVTVDPSWRGVQGSPLGGVVSLSEEYLRDDSRFASIFRHALNDEDIATAMYTLSATDYVSIVSGAVTVIRAPEYRAIPRFAVLADGAVVVQHDDDYIVRIVDATGNTVLRIQRPISAREVTEQDRREWHRRQEERLEALGVRGPAVDVPFAKFMSVVTGLRTDPAGRIWVRRRRADGAEEGRIDIVDRSGDYIGTLVDQRMPVAMGASGMAAFHEVDQLGVERVVVRRLPASWYR